MQLLSRTADGRAANDESDAPTISDDNRYILFSSSATDLAVSNFDSNSVTFLYDRQTAQLSQINPPRLAGRQRGGFFGGRLAPDGRFITMLADVTASAGGSNYVTGVFLYDRLSGALTELSRKRDGTPGNDHSVGATLSADGRSLAPAPTQPVAKAPASLPPSGADMGESQLRLARQYLDGRVQPRNPAVASQLLWSAVEKGNSEAEMDLADLYLHGDGVARNCDQARVLLSVASGKGNPEAMQKLHELDRSGCR